MPVEIRCLNCEVQWEYQDLCDGEDYICRTCNTDETEELYECRCNNCGTHVIANPMDECPECEVFELEEMY